MNSGCAGWHHLHSHPNLTSTFEAMYTAVTPTSCRQEERTPDVWKVTEGRTQNIALEYSDMELEEEGEKGNTCSASQTRNVPSTKAAELPRTLAAGHPNPTPSPAG